MACFVVSIVQLPLHWGWLVDPAGSTLANPFHGVHAWAGDVVGAAWSTGQWPDPTSEAGFPLPHRARFVAWAPLAIAALLRAVLSPVAALNFAALLGPGLGAAACAQLIRTVHPTARTMPLIAGATLFGLAPVTLGAAVSGQIENTQAWVLPLLLSSLAWRAWATGPIWLIGALTSPYLAMMAAFCAPWMAWRQGWRRSILPLLGAGVALLAARAWLGAADFSAADDLFRPSHGGDGFPELWSLPLPVADLRTMLTGDATLQVKAMVLHQPYLGVVFAAGALIFGRAHRVWLPLVATGVLIAMGPVLAWDGGPLAVAEHAIAMPAIAVRWLHLPLAYGGQYYRFMLIAHLGLAGLLATALRPRSTALIGAIAALDALRSVATPGLPWPTVDLPQAAWQAWATDPEPGGVVHLPMFSPDLIPCHPIRLAGHPSHGRALADLPRAWVEPPNHPVTRALDACTRRGARCAPPAKSHVAAAGFRYAVLDLPDHAERLTLRRRLVETWGPPDGEADGLEWWTLAAPPTER